ncbi:MAG: hypothetical protein KGM46_05610 [Pseudomonadota bacterium]|nr:hypothetical protein [Xanthomonadaceae bacterium]MDE2247553.1 hypothetical protein [Xanthomonadaceae bacterium]MDE3210197.1 hypothetical protein [Pseudomonadota bacterium]
MRPIEEKQLAMNIRRQGVKMTGLSFLRGWFTRGSAKPARSAAKSSQGEVGITVRYRMSLASEIQARHALAKMQMRAMLDACRDANVEAAIRCMRQFATTFRQIGLTRSVLLCPYLRWALQRDRAASQQFESTYAELMHSTLMIEAILSDYLGSPWDSDRRRRFVHVVVRVASLFSRGVELEASVLLPLYLPPGQYRYVMDPAGQTSPEDGTTAGARRGEPA